MIEGIEKRVVVIGAGPVGLYCAYLIKKQNPKVHVLIVEEHNEVGEPINCAGHISISGYNKLKLSNLIDIDNCIFNKIKGANIFSSFGKVFNLKTKKYQTYVLNRSKFDKKIYDLCKTLDIHFLFNTKFVSLDKKENKVILRNLNNNSKKEIKYDILVGGDGANSKIRSFCIPNFSNKEFIQTFQVDTKKKISNDLVNIYFSKYSKDFFVWQIPISKENIRFGIGTKLANNPKKSFFDFLENKNINLDKYWNSSSSLIPICKPLDNFVFNKNILLIGDAGCFVKATSGGGIIFGLLSSEIAAKAINKRFNDFKDLKIYNKLVKKYLKELNLHYKFYKYFHNKSLKEIDLFLKKCDSNDLNRFLEKYGNIDFISKFVGKAVFYPKLYSFFKEFLEFLKTK